MSPVPTLFLDTSPLPPKERLAAWRAAIPQYEIEADELAGAFGVTARAWLLEDLIVTHTVVSPTRLSRSLALIQADGADTYNLNVFLHGSSVSEADGRALTIGPGQLVGYDLSRPFTTQSSACECVSLVIGRSALQTAFRGEPALHGHVFDGGAGLLLSDHCLALARHLPNATAKDAPAIVRATLALLSAAIPASRPSGERGQTGHERVRYEVRRYIDRNLGSVDLSPDSICLALNLSRSSLYRCFRPLGGMSTFIQRRRLQAVRALLLHPSEARTTAEVARSLGFARSSHFAAAFRREFGCSPSDVRLMQRIPLGPGKIDGDVSTQFRAWLTSLAAR